MNNLCFSNNLFFKLYENILIEAFYSTNPLKQKNAYRGFNTESLFDMVMAKNNLISKPASYEEDYKFHIDRKVFEKKRDSKGNLIRAWENLPENRNCSKNCNSVEVKGRKIDNNGNLLIEILTINGHLGWLYTKANYIAFLNEDETEFILIKSYYLRNLIEKLGNFKIFSFVDKNIIKHNNNQPIQYVNKKDDAILPKFYKREDESVVTLVSWKLIIDTLNPTLRYKV